MRNKYPGDCCICGKYVKAKQGYFERINPKKIYVCGKRWFIRCIECVGKGAPWKQKCQTCGKKLLQGEGHYKQIITEDDDGYKIHKWIAYCDKCQKGASDE